MESQSSRGTFPDQYQENIWNQLKNASRPFNMLVIAPPGAGKTAVACYCINNLHRYKQVTSNNILVLSYGKNIQIDTKQQLSKRYNLKNQNVKTFHSLAYKIVKKNKEIEDLMRQKEEQDAQLIKKEQQGNSNEPSVPKTNKSTKLRCIDEDQEESLIRSHLQNRLKQLQSSIGNLNLALEEKYRDITTVEKRRNKFISRISKLKIECYQNNYPHPKDFCKHHFQRVKEQRNRLMQKITTLDALQIKFLEFELERDHDQLKQANQATFSYIMYEAVKLLERKSFTNTLLPPELKTMYIIVDQFQDCTQIQLDLLKHLIKMQPRILMMLGDLDQNIYRWQFAEPKNTLKFVKWLNQQVNGCQFECLSKTYRLRHNLKELAYKFLKTDQATYGKERQQRLKLFQEINSSQGIIKDLDNVISHSQEECQILINEYVSEMDEVMEIVQRIYKAHYQEGIAFEDIGILLRSLKMQTGFRNKLKYFSKLFCEKKLQDQGKQIQIPFKYSIQTQGLSQSTSFISRCFEYYFWIHKNGSHTITAKEKQKILNRILKSLNMMPTLQSKFCKDMFYNNQLNLNKLIDPKLREEEVLKKIQNYRMHKDKEIVRQDLQWFSQKLSEFISMCEDRLSPLQIVQFLQQTFLDNEKIKLNSDEACEYYLGFVEELETLQNLKEFLQFGIHQYNKKVKKVAVFTIHQAKGLTFEYLFMPAMNGNFEQLGTNQAILNDPSLDFFSLADRNNINDELKLHFTGITRVKLGLYISRALQDTGYEKWLARKQKRRSFEFLEFILKKNFIERRLSQKDFKEFSDSLRQEKQRKETEKQKRKVEKAQKKKIKLQMQNQLKAERQMKKKAEQQKRKAKQEEKKAEQQRKKAEQQQMKIENLQKSQMTKHENRVKEKKNLNQGIQKNEDLLQISRSKNLKENQETLDKFLPK